MVLWVLASEMGSRVNRISTIVGVRTKGGAAGRSDGAAAFSRRARRLSPPRGRPPPGVKPSGQVGRSFPSLGQRRPGLLAAFRWRREIGPAPQRTRGQAAQRRRRTVGCRVLYTFPSAYRRLAPSGLRRFILRSLVFCHSSHLQRLRLLTRPETPLLATFRNVHCSDYPSRPVEWQIIGLSATARAYAQLPS